MKFKAVTFKERAVVRNCLRPNSGPLRKWKLYLRYSIGLYSLILYLLLHAYS